MRKGAIIQFITLITVSGQSSTVVPYIACCSNLWVSQLPQDCFVAGFYQSRWRKKNGGLKTVFRKVCLLCNNCCTLSHLMEQVKSGVDRRRQLRQGGE